MRTISHWIGGKLWPDAPERTGAVYDPATGEQTGEVAMASLVEVDAAVSAALEAFQEWRPVPVTRRQNIMFNFRQILNDRRREMAETLTAEHGKTVPDALGEVQRGLEVVEFACDIPHLTQGGVLRAGFDRCRHLHDPPAAGSGGRDHALQLPGHGPDVDVPAGDRLPATPLCSSPPRRTPPPPCWRPSGFWRRVFPTEYSTWCTATRWPSTGFSNIPTSRRCRSSGRPRSPATSTRREPDMASGSRRWAGPRTT